MSKFIIAIPARYSSSRLPGKPLVDIQGKSMIKRVWDKCVLASEPNQVFVLTDDKRIADHCYDNQMQFLMTSKNCLTGTDRIYEFAKKNKFETYINVQGDEPLISPNDIKLVIKESQKSPNSIINGMCSISNENDFFNYNVPKVVTNNDNELLYMSRAPIPSSKQNKFNKSKKQVCVYAFPYNALMFFGSCKKKSNIESVEDLEILRFVENGYKVKMVNVSSSSIAVDTPNDLEKVREIIKND